VAISACPVTTDISPPSAAKADACAVRCEAVASQIASPLATLMQPATSQIGVIANNVRFIGFFPCFRVIAQGVRFGPLAGTLPTG